MWDEPKREDYQLGIGESRVDCVLSVNIYSRTIYVKSLHSWLTYDFARELIHEREHFIEIIV